MSRKEFIVEVEKGQKAFRRFLIALCCGDSFLADDIAQDAYIKAWLSIDKYRNDASFNSWIRKIAYNTFLNTKRLKRLSINIDSASLKAAEENSDDSFKYQALYIALQNLSEKERSAILLFYLDGYSIKEIASIINTSESAVKQLLSRGRIHLHNNLLRIK